METADDSDTRSLARWLSRQRNARQSGQLSDEQIAALNELGMNWEPIGSRWQHSFQAASSYQQEHGHLQPPTGTVINGVDLTVWLSRQRAAHQRGTLLPDRVAALNNLGIDWTPNPGISKPRIDQAWQTRLNDARQYHATHGHLRPPTPTTVNGRRLDAWLSVQRARNRQGRLTPEQTAALDALGFHW